MSKMEQVKQYTLGFLFKGDKVLLIQKNRPDWQKGKWNGVGGHIEHGETADYAMKREFKEEADATPNWEWFCSMVFNKAVVHCFRSFTVVDVKTMTDERLFWWEVNDLPKNVIPNLNWLIPMALQSEPEMLRVETQQIDALYTERAGEICDYKKNGTCSLGWECREETADHCFGARFTKFQPDPPAGDLMLTAPDYSRPKDLYHRIRSLFEEWDIFSLWWQKRITTACEAQLKACQDYYQPVIDGLRQENEQLSNILIDIFKKGHSNFKYRDNSPNGDYFYTFPYSVIDQHNALDVVQQLKKIEGK